LGFKTYFVGTVAPDRGIAEPLYYGENADSSDVGHLKIAATIPRLRQRKVIAIAPEQHRSPRYQARDPDGGVAGADWAIVRRRALATTTAPPGCDGLEVKAGQVHADEELASVPAPGLPAERSSDCMSLILIEVVGASGFEPPTSWSRTSLSKIPKPSSWRHLRDLRQQKNPPQIHNHSQPTTYRKVRKERGASILENDLLREKDSF